MIRIARIHLQGGDMYGKRRKNNKRREGGKQHLEIQYWAILLLCRGSLCTIRWSLRVFRWSLRMLYQQLLLLILWLWYPGPGINSRSRFYFKEAFLTLRIPDAVYLASPGATPFFSDTPVARDRILAGSSHQSPYTPCSTRDKTACFW